MIDPNEPAYPRTYSHDGHNGFTKREAIAVAAMQGMLAACDHHVRYGPQEDAMQKLANEAVRCADALLEALNQSSNP
jgi:hypothetical protein